MLLLNKEFTWLCALRFVGAAGRDSRNFTLHVFGIKAERSWRHRLRRTDPRCVVSRGRIERHTRDHAIKL